MYVILTFQSVDEIRYDVTIQIKATEQHFCNTPFRRNGSHIDFAPRATHNEH